MMMVAHVCMKCAALFVVEYKLINWECGDER